METSNPTLRFARHLRRHMSPPELRLWAELRSRKLNGLRFRRQHPIGPYVLDFYCDPAALAVELDGEGHWRGDQPDRDRRRDAWLAARGVETLRIEAWEVRDDLHGVLERIRIAAQARIS